MQRYIKFRGLRVDNGNWVYGSLVNNGFFNSETKESIPYIFNTEECDNAYGWEDFDDDYGYYQVKPESVGQFIANNGVQDFYIGDIVVNPQGRKHTVVIFDNCPCLQYTDAKGIDWYSPMTIGYLVNKRVIGNIHEQK